MLLLSACLSSATLASDYQLPELGGEPYPAEIHYDSILEAFFSGNYQYAYDLLGNYIYQEARKWVADGKYLKPLLEKGLSELAAILNDDSKTAQQKGQDIVALVEKSMTPYESATAGSLNMSFAHSIQYGVTRLSWDKKIEVDKCSGAKLVYECLEWDGGSCLSGGTYMVYWVDYVRKVPDYYIYRVVNGQETLLTKLDGSQDVHRESMTFSNDVFAAIKGIYHYKDDFSFPSDDKAFWYDFNSEYRKPGETLAYRVVADNLRQKYGNCGSSERDETVASADADGNGYMDFVPMAEYSKYRVGGWLVPVLSILE